MFLNEEISNPLRHTILFCSDDKCRSLYVGFPLHEKVVLIFSALSFFLKCGRIAL